MLAGSAVSRSRYSARYFTNKGNVRENATALTFSLIDGKRDPLSPSNSLSSSIDSGAAGSRVELYLCAYFNSSFSYVLALSAAI